MKLNIEFDVENETISRGLAILKRRHVRYGVASALMVMPAVAIAGPVALPNSFEAGNVISASEMNANFEAVRSAVDDNHARISSLEGGVNLGACTWEVTTDTTAVVAVDCGPTASVVSGSCNSSDLNNTLVGHTARPSASTNLMDGDPGGSAKVYACSWTAAAAANTQHVARALCCPN